MLTLQTKLFSTHDRIHRNHKFYATRWLWLLNQADSKKCCGSSDTLNRAMEPYQRRLVPVRAVVPRSCGEISPYSRTMQRGSRLVTVGSVGRNSLKLVVWPAISWPQINFSRLYNRLRRWMTSVPFRSASLLSVVIVTMENCRCWFKTTTKRLRSWAHPSLFTLLRLFLVGTVGGQPQSIVLPPM
jgi:hypothetical protein